MFRDGQWLTAEEPLHTDKPAIAGIGLAMSFAATLLEHQPDQMIGLLPCAVGGTRIARWIPSGDLYQRALITTRHALEPSSRIGGVLWHQGEGDCTLRENAEKYGPRLNQMIESLRIDLKNPDLLFVLGELGDFLKDREACRTWFKLVNRQIRDCTRKLPRVSLVEAADLTDLGDHLHFDASSLREFGRRYAMEYLRLEGADLKI